MKRFILRIPLAVVVFLWGVLAVGQAQNKAIEWIALFDGKSLGGWAVTKFGGEGEVQIKEGQILLDVGDDMTGINWTRDFPKQNYEVRLEAMRTTGHDFFCGLTFPVKESHCSLIVGGWGGTIVGLSSINGQDASENETSQMMVFQEKTWYKIRVRVTQERIQAWIDDKSVVDLELGERHFSTRSEVDWSKPLGIATWRTGAALQNLQMRRLP
jgi:hypothetical protein